MEEDARLMSRALLFKEELDIFYNESDTEDESEEGEEEEEVIASVETKIESIDPASASVEVLKTEETQGALKVNVLNR